MTLKAREFGREITNATSQSSNNGAPSSKQTHSTSQVVLDNAYQPSGAHTSVNASMTSGNSSFSTHVSAATKREVAQHPARLVKLSFF